MGESLIHKVTLKWHTDPQSASAVVAYRDIVFRTTSQVSEHLIQRVFFIFTIFYIVE
jgi:hypothetical protein